MCFIEILCEVSTASTALLISEIKIWSGLDILKCKHQNNVEAGKLLNCTKLDSKKNKYISRDMLFNKKNEKSYLQNRIYDVKLPMCVTLNTPLPPWLC